MYRSRFSLPSNTQRGAALLVVMLFFFLAATTVFLQQSNAVGARNRADMVTASLMAQAKDALIGKSASNDNLPGSLTCPDTDDDGMADGAFGNCTSLVGRLPWKTLHMSEPLDGHGERLWYAISFKLRDNVASRPLNAQQPLELSLDGTLNIAAILFSPGSPLANQLGRPSNALGDYLDGSNGDGDNAYVSKPASDNFNDKTLAISRDEIFRTVNQRILAEIRGPDDNAPGTPSFGLRRYHAVKGEFPWPANNNDGHEDVGNASANKLPYADLSFDSSTLTWLNDNQWFQLIGYRRLGPQAAQLMIGSSVMDILPCSSSPCP